MREKKKPCFFFCTVPDHLRHLMCVCLVQAASYGEVPGVCNLYESVACTNSLHDRCRWQECRHNRAPHECTCRSIIRMAISWQSSLCRIYVAILMRWKKFSFQLPVLRVGLTRASKRKVSYAGYTVYLHMVRHFMASQRNSLPKHIRILWSVFYFTGCYFSPMLCFFVRFPETLNNGVLLCSRISKNGILLSRMRTIYSWNTSCSRSQLICLVL